jgi:hypothetical protein
MLTFFLLCTSTSFVVFPSSRLTAVHYHGDGFTRSLFLFSGISGQFTVVSNSLSSGCGAGPSASTSSSSGNKRSSATTIRVLSSGTLWIPLGGNTSLRIDAMMSYEFQRRNCESFHAASLDEFHIPSLSNSTFVTRHFFL